MASPLNILGPVPPTTQPPPPRVGNGGNGSGSGVGQILLAILLYAVTLLIVILSTKNSEENWRLVALVCIACHIYLSITVINERQLGALFRLGRPIRDLDSGPCFAFWPLYYVRTETRNIIQIEIGLLEPEERAKAEKLKESVSVYLMEDPLRVNWGDMKSALPPATDEEKTMFKGNPYGDAMVTDTHVTTRFRICSLTNLIRKAGSLEEGIEQVRGVVVSTLISHAGKSFVGRVIRNMEEMDNTLQRAVEEFVVEPTSDAYRIRGAEASWGIDVEKTQITRLGTSKRVNTAIADKGKIIYDAQAERVRLQEVGAGTADAIRSKAEADEIRLRKEGAGNAEAEKLLLFARQEGLRRLSEIARTPEGQLILQLQALERGLKEGKTVILPMELSRIVGFLGDRLK